MDRARNVIHRRILVMEHWKQSVSCASKRKRFQNRRNPFGGPGSSGDASGSQGKHGTARKENAKNGLPLAFVVFRFPLAGRTAKVLTFRPKVLGNSTRTRGTVGNEGIGAHS